jgi:hypothetical protein
MKARDKTGGGPFGALLILLSLLLGSGTAAASGPDLRSSTTRLAPNRASATAALVPSGVRDPSGEDSSAAGAGAARPSFGPGVVTRGLWERPAAEFPGREEIALPAPADPSNWARAPPAA